MVDFRRWIIVAAMLALFAGLAGAQVSGVVPLACTASVAVPPQLRTEGLTELIGDIVLTCTGGSPLASGSTVPTANIVVSLGTNVTSRILSTGSLNGGPTQNVSDALLLIDEPGSGIPLPPAYRVSQSVARESVRQRVKTPASTQRELFRSWALAPAVVRRLSTTWWSPARAAVPSR